MNEDSCKCFASEKWRILIKTLKNCYLLTLSNKYLIRFLNKIFVRKSPCSKCRFSYFHINNIQVWIIIRSIDFALYVWLATLIFTEGGEVEGRGKEFN